MVNENQNIEIIQVEDIKKLKEVEHQHSIKLYNSFFLRRDSRKKTFLEKLINSKLLREVSCEGSTKTTKNKITY